MSKYRITVDENTCQGIGYCKFISPEIFSVNEERRVAVVLKNVVEGAHMIALAEEAEASCPTRAITLSRIK